MAHDSSRSAHRIFAEAAKLPQAERPAFLERACGADAALRGRIEMMLAARDAAAGFSPSLAADAAAQVHADVVSPPTSHGVSAGDDTDPPAAGDPDDSVDVFGDVDARRRHPSNEPLASILRDVPDSHIGPYRLLERLGVGGFGVVFMAEQDRPVKRRVAIKIIKLGMDTQQVIARFEAERQALAIMDHPNIAKVFDAGATASGRPYFVMELVKGVPITHYCDEHRLDLRQRLELFRKVCLAVQHAHQKGVIHRDIKPNNVLVTVIDNEPVPKVIDFGIAKATHARLTERTMVTEANQFIGTPEYMSPEQADTSGLDIDTRTDIYSLGVLLYELLTGTTPLEPLRLRQAGLTALQRMICDEDAPRPSARVESLGPLLEATARRLSMPAPRLAPALRGDLDWIVLKALEKDRNRRYDTAVALAADITRFLTNRPVEASPPSRSYRVRKFVQRNRRGVIAAGVVAATLVLGIVGTGTFLVISLIQARHSAEVSALLTRLFGASTAAQGAMDDVSTEGVLADVRRLFDDDVGVRDQVLLSYGARLRNAGRLDEAGSVLTESLRRLDPSVAPGDVAGARLLLAQVRSEQGRYRDAVAEAGFGIELLAQSPEDSRRRGIALTQLAAIHGFAGATRDAFISLRDAAVLLADSREGVLARCDAAILLAGDREVAGLMTPSEREPFLRQSLWCAGTLDENEPRRFATQYAVASYHRTVDSSASKAELGDMLLEAARLSGLAFSDTSRTHLNNLRAIAQQMRGERLDERALPLVATMLTLAAAQGANDPIRIDAYSGAAAIYAALGREADALDATRRVHEASRAIRGETDPSTLKRGLLLARQLRMARADDRRTERVGSANEIVAGVLRVLDLPELADMEELREEALDEHVELCKIDPDARPGDVPAAFKALRKAIVERRRGIVHTDVANCTLRYAAWLDTRGRLAEAAGEIDEALDAAKQNLIPPNEIALSFVAMRGRLGKLTGDDLAKTRLDVLWRCDLARRLISRDPARLAEVLREEGAWLLENGFSEDGRALTAEAIGLGMPPGAGAKGAASRDSWRNP